jgi:hypothetical protein
MSMHSFAFPFFLYGLSNLVFVCWILFVLMSLLKIEWFNSSATIVTVLTVYFIFGWLLRAFNSIYKLVIFMICKQIFGIDIINHIPYVTTVQSVLNTNQVSTTKHFLFTALPETDFTECIKYLCFLSYNIQSRAKVKQLYILCNLFGIIPVVDSTGGII